MQIIGIICEYNPFHNGHLYHINKIKEMFPRSLIILVLNGYFLQRGEISIISKEDKTKIALENNIDLIVELPVVFGTQSADTFASMSIKILENLQAQYVVFGSESNDLDKIYKISEYMIYNDKEFNNNFKDNLKKGLNYPTALSKALYIEFAFSSNDLLGISYVKTIIENKYNIKPLTIKRTNNYLDITSNDSIISANNIRTKLKNNENIDKFVPQNITSYIKNISLNNFYDILKYKIITSKNLDIYLDVEEGIENRIKKVINDCKNVDELIEKIKSKRYTYNKIRRMLIHILLDFTKNDNQELKLDYIRILGFNQKGQNYLNKIKDSLNISIIPSKNSLQYKYELISASLFSLITKEDTIKFEKNCKPIIKF